MQKQKKIFSILLLLIICFPFLATAQPVDPAFNPNKLIDDKVFSDTQTFGGAEGIQKFLTSKGSVLANTDPEFLIKLKEPAVSSLKSGLEDPQPNLTRLRTAAELLWDASRQSGLNPQVLLITLNKEQSLITGQFPKDSDLQKALDHALGFACPDNGGCGDLFPGFYYQLFGNFDAAGNRYLGASKSLMKSYSASNGRGPILNGQISHVGDSITLDNTLGGFENIEPSQTVTLSNNATAALYRYTPHVFNGNYNFWRFFNSWFRYPNGTLLKLSNSDSIFIIQNGLKQQVPKFVAQARNLDLTSAIIVSPIEFDSYTTDQILGPIDNTIVTTLGTGQKYVFINNIRHPVSDFVIKQRGLDISKTISMSQSDSDLFKDGAVLTPKDGTIIRGTKNQSVYLVVNNSLQLFSAFTFKQRKISTKQISLVSDSEIQSYPKQGFVEPMDGTLIKSEKQPTIYFVQNGLKQPILGNIFKNRGFKTKDIAVLSSGEVDNLPLGNYAMPKDYTFFNVGDNKGSIMEFKGGTTHSISTTVAKQRGITPDYIFSQDVVNSWPTGIPVPPKDGSVVKGDIDETIYLVANSQLRPMTYQAFKNRKITTKKIMTLPQIEIESYAKGEILSK